jgi:hypothetical protein
MIIGSDAENHRKERPIAYEGVAPMKLAVSCSLNCMYIHVLQVIPGTHEVLSKNQ